jgi:hypothetical protein
MFTKVNKILIGLLAVQLALVAVVYLRGDESHRTDEAALLPGFDAAKVTRVQVTARTGAPLDLVKRGTGWVVASAFDYPADATAVTDALAPLAKVKIADPIATSPARHKQLAVADADAERKLTLTIDGKDTVIFVGGSSGIRRKAVRLGGEDRVYAATGASALAISNEPRDWVKRSYFQAPRDGVSKIELKLPARTVTLTRQDAAAPAGSGSAVAPAPWVVTIDGATPKDELDASQVEAIASAVSSIDVDAPADPKRAVTTAAATITVTAKDGTTVLDVVADGDRYWVKRRGAAEAITVNKAQLAAAVEASAATLAKKPPPPPAPTPPDARPSP